MEPRQLNPIEQRQCAEKINTELAKMTISWTADLREWHPVALEALGYASVAGLQTTGKNYGKLLTTDSHGINANVCALLCNNLETVTPSQMKMSLNEFALTQELNQRVADHWEAFVGPVRDKVVKEFQTKPKIHTINSNQ
jgi:hypothetical protein